jgi:hypothetical protein
VRYKVYGENGKKVPNAANNFKGKDIGPDRLHVDDILKRQLRGTRIKCAIWTEGNSLGENILRFLLRKRKGALSECQFTSKIKMVFYLSRHGSGCEHKGHSKKKMRKGVQRTRQNQK